MSTPAHDVVVVGGGPAGLTAALYLTRSGCSVALVEKLTPGGQVLQTETIENYPGYPKGIKGYELADLFAAHLDGLDVARVNGEVKSLVPGEVAGKPGFTLTLAGQEGELELGARAVVVASGASHRRLGLREEPWLIGKGVSYCAICDGNFFRGQDVVVVGGGNTALEESLYLSKIVRKVYLVHRRDAFRGARVYLDRLMAIPDKVEIIRSSVVTKITGMNAVESVTVKRVDSGEERVLNAQGLFVFVGNIPNAAFVPDGVERDPQGFVVTDTEMRTAVPGIFAAGDVRAKLCRQVSTAVGDGATAAQAAFLYLEHQHA